MIIRQQKKEYNTDIKEYNSIMKSILNEEKQMEEIENKINKIRQKQLMTLSMINKDFVNHLNDFTNRLHPEIVESLMEFLGFAYTPIYSLKV
jgi:hypothetical protein